MQDLQRRVFGTEKILNLTRTATTLEGGRLKASTLDCRCERSEREVRPGLESLGTQPVACYSPKEMRFSACDERTLATAAIFHNTAQPTCVVTVVRGGPGGPPRPRRSWVYAKAREAREH
jgi:hypothetical protein